MTGRRGGRASGYAGTRDFTRIAYDENETEKRRREDTYPGFNGKQGTGRPPYALTEHASGMNDKYVRGYDACMIGDGSRFELRYVAVESQPWHVVDSDAGDNPEKGPEDKVKKFNTQEEAEKYILDENRKEFEKDQDDRKELHYRDHPKE